MFQFIFLPTFADDVHSRLPKLFGKPFNQRRPQAVRMAGGQEKNVYEELRKKNVERNESMMRFLGLGQSSVPEQVEQQVGRNQRLRKKTDLPPRRSARLALLKESCLHGRESCDTESASTTSLFLREGREGPEHCLKRRRAVDMERQDHENSEEYESVGEEYSTDDSLNSMYEARVDLDVDGTKVMPVNVVASDLSTTKHGEGSSAGIVDLPRGTGQTSFGSDFQQFVLHALLQTTAALMGSSSSVPANAEGASIGSPLLITEGCRPPSTWKEAVYNISQARRKRTMQTMRTSAGEGSDSQEDFPIPENETAQQKLVRTRRLNRSRVRRAKELSNSRRAQNKLPYVIHVDGTCRARGIHKHQWRAAVRGQCGRLDPSMDNINHHPKHVVDSIWNALEKEWEFEGYVHRSREMFEKAATKCMRNRKMQLKYKCKKMKESKKPEDSKKPDDVIPSHREKIKHITKTSFKQMPLSTVVQTTGKGKEKLPVHEAGAAHSLLMLEASKEQSGMRSPIDQGDSGSIVLQKEEVDARIRSLQSELQKLQKSREVELSVEDVSGKASLASIGKVEMSIPSQAGSQKMKENLNSDERDGHEEKEASAGNSGTKMDQPVQVKLESGTEDSNNSLFFKLLRKVNPNNLENTEMDCGEVVRMYAIIGGKKKEVAKGIVMALAGSKHARKVIPKGWRCVKITSYTSNAATQACPIPAGWADQVKQQTVKEASGRTILWPDSLLHSILHI